MKNTNYAAEPTITVVDGIATVTIGHLSHEFTDLDDVDTTNRDLVGDVAIEWLDAFHYGPEESGVPDALSDLCARLESAIVAAIPPVWTYEGYWNAVVGAYSTPADAVRGNGLAAVGVDEWLSLAETTAWREGGFGGDIPGVWTDHHARAIAALAAAVEAP